MDRGARIGRRRVFARKLAIDVDVQVIDGRVASRVAIFGSQQLLEVPVVSHGTFPPGIQDGLRRSSAQHATAVVELILDGTVPGEARR